MAGNIYNETDNPCRNSGIEMTEVVLEVEEISLFINPLRFVIWSK